MPAQTPTTTETPSYTTIATALPWPHRAFPVHRDTRKPAIKRWNHHPRTQHTAQKQQQGYQLRFDELVAGVRLGYDPLQDLALTVLDVDFPDALTEYQREALEKWPWLVMSNRGYHAYGQPVDATGLKTVKAPAWGEYLAKSAYVLAPGSTHWQSGITYLALPGFGEGPPPVFPWELLSDLLAPPPEGSAGGATTPNSPPCPPGGYKANATPPQGDSRLLIRLEDALTLAQPGTRHPNLFEALRHWSYRQPQPDDLDTWTHLVKRQALAYAERIPNRDNFPDSEAVKMGYHVAGWTWEKRFRPPAPDPQLQAVRQLAQARSRREANRERDDRILELHRQGWSLRAIGADVGIHHVTVKRVIARGGRVAATPEETANSVRPRPAPEC